MPYQYSVREARPGEEDVLRNREPSRGASRVYNVREACPRRYPRLARDSVDSNSRLARDSYNVREVHPEGSYSSHSSCTRSNNRSATDNWSNIADSGCNRGHGYHVREAAPRGYNDHRSPPSTSNDSSFGDYHYCPRSDGSSKIHTAFPTRISPTSPRPNARSSPHESSSHSKDSHSRHSRSRDYKTRTTTPAYIPTPPQPSPGVNLYAILGVSRDATAEELKKAHRTLSLKHHPDRVPEAKKEEATENMAKINQAYDVLKNGEKKDKYDRFGEF